MIRLSKRDDLPQLLEIEHLGCYGPPWTSREFGEYYRSRKRKLYVWENDTGICGFICFERVNRYRDIDIINLAVHPSCWRKGIGTALLVYAIGKSGPRVEVCVDPTKDEIYSLLQKAGFTVEEALHCAATDRPIAVMSFLKG